VNDLEYMRIALDQALQSKDDVPVGALLVSSEGQILAKSHNLRERNSDPSAHAEIVVLREAARQRGDWRLGDCTLYVTLEPCAMCATAIVDARLSRLVFGAWDLRLGAAGSKYDILRDPAHGGEVEVVGGILAEESSSIISKFFEAHRR